MPESPGFVSLAERLVRHVRERVRCGDLTEASLAALIGYSQPHIHNVLNGKKGLSFALADDLLAFSKMPLAVLCSRLEQPAAAPTSDPGTRSAISLRGHLGAGAPYPVFPDLIHEKIVEIPRIHGIINPLVLRIGPNETSMRPLIHPRDTVAIDSAPNARRRLDPENIYALCWENRGYLGRCRLRGDWIEISVDNPDTLVRPPASVSLAGGTQLLDLVRGKVIWLSRQLDPESKTRGPSPNQ